MQMSLSLFLAKVTFLGYLKSSTNLTLILRNGMKEKIKDLLLENKRKCICRISLIQLEKIIRNSVAIFSALIL